MRNDSMLATVDGQRTLHTNLPAAAREAGWQCHRQENAPENSQRASAPPTQRLREYAIAVAQGNEPSEGRQRVDLSRVWLDLVEGRTRVESGFCVGGQAYMILSAVNDVAVPLPARAAFILKSTLMGERQKVRAYDCACSPSSIATLLKATLETLGLCCSFSRAPLLLAMLAHAAGRPSAAEGTLATFLHADEQYLLVGAQLPGGSLSSRLPPAVEEVVRLRLAGSTHAEIAVLRKTSLRTVANQLATASQRLGVSGRFELVRLLATTT